MASLAHERLTPQKLMPRWVHLEHLARFKFGAKFVKNKVVVDCACGSGIGSRIFAAAGAKEIYAFDADEEEITNIKKLHCDALHFFAADARQLPLSDNFADIYISLETIEHIDGDKEYLREATRVLKPGGIFICSTPNRCLTNPGKTINDNPWNKFHVREYSREEFVNLLSPYFGKIELYGQNSVCSQRARLFNFLGKILPFHVAVRINQIMKLPRIIYDTEERRQVQEIKPGFEYEYLVAVCYS